MNAAQVVGPEHTPPASLKCLENVEGFSQFFVRCRHKPSANCPGHYKFIVPCHDKHIMLCHYKQIVLCEYKHIMLFV